MSSHSMNGSPTLGAHEPTDKRHTRVIRFSAYSVATVLAVLATTATLPPIVADQSDRAVINAPVTLVTAPIHGEVTAVASRVGEQLPAGAMVAQLRNSRVDRTTLITLESKVDELEAGVQAARQRKDADNAYVAVLDDEIHKQVQQMTLRFESEVTEARARVAAADASGLAKKAVVERQETMVARNAASVDMVRPTRQHYEAARFDKEAEVAKLNQKVSQIDGLKKQIFVGNDLNGLAVLAQKRRDIAFDAQRAGIEEVQLIANLKGQQMLLRAERERLGKLTSARITAANGGAVLNLGVTPGRHVNAGDSVATIANCENAFVVSIFSYRKAQSLAVGTAVTVSGGNAAPMRGFVSDILPKTSDKTDEQYAVPFPQTERREMYVLVALERDPEDESQANSAPNGQVNPCSIGQWVTVTRDNGWLPSASVVWKSVANVFSSSNSASASPRRTPAQAPRENSQTNNARVEEAFAFWPSPHRADRQTQTEALGRNGSRS